MTSAPGAAVVGDVSSADRIGVRPSDAGAVLQ